MPMDVLAKDFINLIVQLILLKFIIKIISIYLNLKMNKIENSFK